jgi:hypothetical protein
MHQQKIASRSRWQGGGFGLSGAVKGAITAKALNAGMDVFHSFGDSAQEQKISDAFASKQRALLNSDSTYQTIETAIYDCIFGILRATVSELQNNGDLLELSIEPNKAEALFKNATRFQEVDAEKMIDISVQCLQLNPFFQDIYTGLLECDPENEDLINLAMYFSTYPDIEKKLQQLNHEIESMDGSTEKAIIEKLDKCVKVEKLYKVSLNETGSKGTRRKPEIIADELVEYCQKNNLLNLENSISALKKIQQTAKNVDLKDKITTLENLQDERRILEEKKEKEEAIKRENENQRQLVEQRVKQYENCPNRLAYSNIVNCIQKLKESKADVSYTIFCELKHAQDIAEPYDKSMEVILDVIGADCELVITDQLLMGIRQEFESLKRSDWKFTDEQSYQDYWSNVKNFLDAIKRLIQSIPLEKIQYKDKLCPLLLETTAYFMKHETNWVYHDGKNYTQVNIPKSLHLHIREYLRTFGLVKDGLVGDDYIKQKAVEDYWDKYEQELGKDTPLGKKIAEYAKEKENTHIKLYQFILLAMFGLGVLIGNLLLGIVLFIITLLIVAVIEKKREDSIDKKIKEFTKNNISKELIDLYIKAFNE